MEAKINFVVPDRRVLMSTEEKIITDQSPGIFINMIDTLSKSDLCENASFKLCVDGRRLNPSSAGEVNLWGFEDQPTFESKKDRLMDELCFFEEIIKDLEHEISLNHLCIADLTTDRKKDLTSKCETSIMLLSKRIRDLRQLKVKRGIVLKKLQERYEGDWRKSQYAMVISSIRTSVYRIENCIEVLLNLNDKFMQMMAAFASKHVNLSSEVMLENIDNYVCLGAITSHNTQPHLIKQRTEAWFDRRKQSLVTGSTIHKAIGLGTLKEQRKFIEVATEKRNPDDITEELRERFEYGTRNEINGIATFTTKFIPAFHSNCSVFEEGCYTIESDGDIKLIVSPDGSVRDRNSEDIMFRIEVKCPYPDKTYTTQVQYNLPHYYVCQILSEMKALGVNELHFLSFTKESTAIHKAMFDSVLWGRIFEEICDLKANKIPTKTSENVKLLREQTKQYTKTHVKLVAEIKSCSGKCCHQKEQLECNGRIYHGNTCQMDEDILQENVAIESFVRAYVKCKETIELCHALCVDRASEVLVFVLSDLDRMSTKETSHAYPVGYALRRYSVKSEAMRKLIQRVLHCLFMQGFYIPTVSYDGEWAAIAFKASTGKPLTLLELQKKVYNDVKERNKSSILKEIFETAVVNITNVDDLKNICMFKNDGQLFLSTKTDTKLFCPSVHIHSLIESNRRGDSKEKNKRGKETKDESVVLETSILSALSPDVITKLDDEVVSEISCMDTSSSMNESGCIGANSYQLCDTHIFDNMSDCEAVLNENDFYTLQACPVTVQESVHVEAANVFGNDDAIEMLKCLQNLPKYSSKWQHKELADLLSLLKDNSSLANGMTRNELAACLGTGENQLNTYGIKYCKSWQKQKLVDLLHRGYTSPPWKTQNTTKAKSRRTPPKLSILCKRKINQFPKMILNAIVAEHDFQEEVKAWRNDSPFSGTTTVEEVGEISWFSCPEFNPDTLSYVFSFLDIHHLITNCRVNVCKDGFPERQISRNAWVKVAKKNTTKLKVSHVEDLVDRQSDSIAKETFSKDVEEEMKRLGYQREAQFCNLIRGFYEAEDNPGLPTIERCLRRLALREWMLTGVQFCAFPPSGSHVNGIPRVMFQGLLTNIERRIQLFPYTKAGKYNVRALGSLEIENLFGEFQDLDPKGSGVIKAEDVPAALDSSCQLLKTRLLHDKKLYMSLSSSKVYPLNDLMDTEQPAVSKEPLFLYPVYKTTIKLKNHEFDSCTRAKRTPKRKSVGISSVDSASKGMGPVRQHHRIDESKIFPHKRHGIQLD